MPGTELLLKRTQHFEVLSMYFTEKCFEQRTLYFVGIQPSLLTNCTHLFLNTGFLGNLKTIVLISSRNLVKKIIFLMQTKIQFLTNYYIKLWKIWQNNKNTCYLVILNTALTAL